MTTKGDKKRLSARKRLALSELVKGATDIEAAEAAGVHRTTVNEWRNRDPQFILELNRELNKLHKASLASFTDRIKELTDASLQTVLQAVKAGDTISARWCLDKVAGLNEVVGTKFSEVISPPEPLSENIETIITQIADKELQKILMEEGISELDVCARPEVVGRVRGGLVAAIKQEYFEKEKT